MSEIRFEWDEKKHSLNKRKHGISFSEGQTIFADENGLLLDDPDHSHDEDRFILLGLSSSLRLLVVSHTYRKDDAIIRIISARKATRSEQEQYWKRWKT
ncbi:MAG: BrnT family toxin [Syntrophorhabdales bacterium]|jgi:hypothetical protein